MNAECFVIFNGFELFSTWLRCANVGSSILGLGLISLAISNFHRVFRLLFSMGLGYMLQRKWRESFLSKKCGRAGLTLELSDGPKKNFWCPTIYNRRFPLGESCVDHFWQVKSGRLATIWVSFRRPSLVYSLTKLNLTDKKKIGVTQMADDEAISLFT